MTGLGLIRARGQHVTRLAKASFGAMNPLVRTVGEDPGSWGRFDVPAHRTIYAADPVEAAYAEALAAIRPGNLAIPLQELFPDTPGGAGTQTLMDQVSKEWREDPCVMLPGTVAAGWRHDRLEYPLTLPRQGWLVDVEHVDTLATLNAVLGRELGQLGVQQVTRGEVLGVNRGVTTLIAAWVHGRVLDDGSLPHGIIFGSKHGAQYKCVAVWLRAVDDGKPLSSEPTKSGPGREVKRPEHNEPLRRIVERFRLARVY